MIEHHEGTDDDVRLTFTQAPPGLAGILLDASSIRELAEKSIPIGWIFNYKPDTPQKDLTFQSCCCDIPAALRHAAGRLVADTDRACERLTALLHEHDTPDLVTIGRWLTNHEKTTEEPMPRELEIELTTDDPYPNTLLRPRGSRVEARGPIDLALVERAVTELIRYDDALVVLGGFGDPLRHPRFASILETIRSVMCDGHGLYGLAVRTSGVDLNDETIEAMISYKVDVLEVTLDAWSAELFGRLQSPDHPHAADLTAVIERLDRLAQTRQRHGTVEPIVVPAMTKARDNVHELDDFYDGWLRRVGAVSITGYSHCGSQCEDRSVIRMAPSQRVGCRRIRSRCLVLSDGRVTMCDQDFNGRHTVGRLGEQSLQEAWRGTVFQQTREAHRHGRFDPTPLCATCEEWHRP
jgi:hypothetical protein